MCLLVFAWKLEPGFPLVAAANRDERLERPAESLCVLREHDPRILGGRDELAGGTWLAVNEHGVVAGLTNRPSPGGRDPSKRSRGELPLFAASRPSAAEGVDELLGQVRPGQYNPAWMLIGDRKSLHYVEIPADEAPRARLLPPGLHVLENVGYGEPSPKVDHIRSLLKGAGSGDPPLWDVLPSVLADHTVPMAEDEQDPAVHLDDATTPSQKGQVVVRPLETRASCVHTEGYGTRSSMLVRLPLDPVPPEVLVADGPPCETAFVAAAF
jgi:uncharacterized protein with NRDE domain